MVSWLPSLAITPGGGLALHRSTSIHVPVLVLRSDLPPYHSPLGGLDMYSYLGGFLMSGLLSLGSFAIIPGGGLPLHREAFTSVATATLCCKYMHMLICKYMYIFTYKCTHLSTCINIFVHIFVYIFRWMHPYV
jgi:hypothetical protein